MSPVPHDIDQDIDVAARYRVHQTTPVGFDPISARPTLLGGGTPIPLSDVGYRLILLCDGTQTLGDMLEALVANFRHTPRHEVATEAVATLRLLDQRGQLETLHG